MDINVTVEGIDELSPEQEKRIHKVVKSTVKKEIWKEKDDASRRTALTVIREAPSLVTMFLSTTYGAILFVMAVAIIAIPAATIGGAIYVSNNSDVVQYKINEQEVPQADNDRAPTVEQNPYKVTPASTEDADR